MFNASFFSVNTNLCMDSLSHDKIRSLAVLISVLLVAYSDRAKRFVCVGVYECLCVCEWILFAVLTHEAIWHQFARDYSLGVFVGAG